MNFVGKRVLLLDAYARQTLPMARGFKKIGCVVTVTCYSKLDVGYTSKYPDHRIIMNCSRDDHVAQFGIVKQLIESREFDLVVPMNDDAAIYLAENKEYLENYTRIAVNDSAVFQRAINKLCTMEVCRDNGIPAPKTVFADKAVDAADDDSLAYPVVVKPQTACGSIGFNIATDKEHLKRILEIAGNKNGPVFIQEYIPQDGPQYGVEAFRNKDGRYSFLVVNKKPRWFPLDGGSPTINISTHNDEMAFMSKKLLDAIGWNGYANIDIIVDCRTHQPKVIEINGRISAAVSIDEELGINVAELICENEFNTPMTMYSDYKDDICVSCILTEALWFVKSKERLINKPTMFHRKNTRDVIFRWSDPIPFFSFCLQSVKNYKNAIAQRKRT